MKYTIAYMEKMFHFVNEELFDNMLDMPTFKAMSTADIKEFLTRCEAYPDCQNLPEFEGICCPSHLTGDSHYFIGIWDELKPADFFNTFVHELIHISCMETHEHSGHWGIFRMWTEKAIERFYGDFEEL